MQTHDYALPATACSLQDRLQLSRSCAALTSPSYDVRTRHGRQWAGDSGALRSATDLYMNGAEVFVFTLERVPRLIGDVLEGAGCKHLGKRMNVPSDKLVISLDEFGNTSSASIPLAISHRLASRVNTRSANLILAGFGIGWSWGAVRSSVTRIIPVLFPW